MSDWIDHLSLNTPKTSNIGNVIFQEYKIHFIALENGYDIKRNTSVTLYQKNIGAHLPLPQRLVTSLLEKAS